MILIIFYEGLTMLTLSDTFSNFFGSLFDENTPKEQKKEISQSAETLEQRSSSCSRLRERKTTQAPKDADKSQSTSNSNSPAISHIVKRQKRNSQPVSTPRDGSPFRTRITSNRMKLQKELNEEQTKRLEELREIFNRSFIEYKTELENNCDAKIDILKQVKEDLQGDFPGVGIAEKEENSRVSDIAANVIGMIKLWKKTQPERARTTQEAVMNAIFNKEEASSDIEFSFGSTTPIHIPMAVREIWDKQLGPPFKILPEQKVIVRDYDKLIGLLQERGFFEST